MTDRPAYRARIWRDPEDDAWLVECVEEPRAHSYGRSIAAARANAVEVIGLWFHHDAEDDFDVDCQIEVPDDVGALVDRVRADRTVIADAQERVSVDLREAARRLTGSGLTVRDAAELLGVSYQRVAQLVAEQRAG